MTDAELVHQTLAGRATAYDLLVRRYAARVLAVCHARVGRASAAEDLAQEALVRGLSSLKSLSDGEKFGPWICGIASRACLDWLKRAERKTVSLEGLNGDNAGGHQPFSAAASDDPSQRAELQDELARLLGAVESLPDNLREAVMLYYYEDCSYEELAARLGVSTATINARLTQARQALRRGLGAPEQTHAWAAGRRPNHTGDAPAVSEPANHHASTPPVAQ